jgi:hypothetical protein
LLGPRDEMGGWYLLKVDDFHSSIGREAWTRFARYVDEHMDDAWVRLCLYALAGGISMGLLCLFLRYFGLMKEFFHPVEFGVIVLLVFLNFSIATFIVSVAFGVHEGEAAVREAILRVVREQKAMVDEWLNRQQAQGAANFNLQANRAAEPETDPPPNPAGGNRRRGPRA